jgi:hypothetical protein
MTLLDTLQLHLIRFVPTPSPSLPSGTDADAQTIVNWTAGGAAVACLIGLMIVGAKMAIAQRHNEEFNAGGLGKVFVGGIIIAAAAPMITALIG